MTDESTDNPSMSGSAAVVRGPRWEQRRGCAAGRWFDWAGGDSVPRSQLPWFQKLALSGVGCGFCAWSVSGQVATSNLYVVSSGPAVGIVNGCGEKRRVFLALRG